MEMRCGVWYGGMGMGVCCGGVECGNFQLLMGVGVGRENS